MQYISRIKIACEQKKVTVKLLAEKIGVSETGLHKMFKENSMKVSTLIMISKALELPILYFLQDEINRENEIDRVFDALKEIVKQKIG